MRVRKQVFLVKAAGWMVVPLTKLRKAEVGEGLEVRKELCFKHIRAEISIKHGSFHRN